MIQRYLDIKKALPPNTILLLRLGDFYEIFFEDAQTAAKIMEVAVTKRNNIPMCGIPCHSKDSYIKPLIQAGYQIALAEP
jgi:DNA mismatch repair protein MutS